MKKQRHTYSAILFVILLTTISIETISQNRQITGKIVKLSENQLTVQNDQQVLDITIADSTAQKGEGLKVGVTARVSYFGTNTLIASEIEIISIE